MEEEDYEDKLDAELEDVELEDKVDDSIEPSQLDSKIDKLTDEYKYSVTFEIIYGHTPREGDEIQLLDEEIDNYKVIDGIKRINYKVKGHKIQENIVKPRVIVTPFRVAAIGGLREGTGKYSIAATAIDMARGTQKAVSMWFSYNPEEPEFMRQKNLIFKGYTGLKRFYIHPARINSGMLGKSINISQELTDLKNKTKYHEHVLNIERKVDENKILETILEFQQNPKTITLSQAYDYFIRDPKVLKPADI